MLRKFWPLVTVLILSLSFWAGVVNAEGISKPIPEHSPADILENMNMADTNLADVNMVDLKINEDDSQKHTLTVAPQGAQYKTIKEAVAAAKPGDTISIGGGTYHEQIILDKSIKLLGENIPVIDGDGKGDVLTLTADNCVVKGLEIRNSGTDLSKDQSGIKIKSNHNVIEQNRLVENLMGIYLYSANENTIANNTVQGRKDLKQSSRGNGIHLWNSSYNTIAGNEITDNRDALYFSFADHNTITKNIAYGERVGIHYMYSNYNKLSENTLHDNIDGIAMMNSHQNVLQNNRVYHNDEDGILLKELDNNQIEGNYFYNNKLGMYIYNADHNTIKGNLFAANLTGLNIDAGSDYNLFALNRWEQNQIQVSLTDPVHNRWDDGKNGNYWSDYTGSDLNDDGIGDDTYWQSSLTENLVREFPLVKLLFNSPAMQAINAAEKAFPVLHPPGVVDHFPLVRSKISLKGLAIDWNPQFKVAPSEQMELMAM